jgi:hypothetical protein
MAKLSNKKTKLPNKPSALIRVAVEDLKQVERHKRLYKVDMDIYHCPLSYFDDENNESIPDPKKPCYVCFAGSVIAKTLKADRTQELNPEDFDSDTYKKLEALNLFRIGMIEKGLYKMDLEQPKYVAKEAKVVDYEDDPKEFKKEMLALANTLEGAGL